jgi:hypothetical protein
LSIGLFGCLDNESKVDQAYRRSFGRLNISWNYDRRIGEAWSPQWTVGTHSFFFQSSENSLLN